MDGYKTVSEYTLKDFMTFYEQQYDIIVPKERLDKTIYVSK